LIQSIKVDKYSLSSSPSVVPLQIVSHSLIAITEDWFQNFYQSDQPVEP